jgi:hypothetical protein
MGAVVVEGARVVTVVAGEDHIVEPQELHWVLTIILDLMPVHLGYLLPVEEVRAEWVEMAVARMEARVVLDINQPLPEPIYIGVVEVGGVRGMLPVEMADWVVVVVVEGPVVVRISRLEVVVHSIVERGQHQTLLVAEMPEPIQAVVVAVLPIILRVVPVGREL